MTRTSIRNFLREHRPNGHPKRIDIALLPIVGAIEHLWRHKHRRADRFRHFHRLVRGTARPKVGQLRADGVLVLREGDHQKVVGLQVAVDDVVLVQVLMMGVLSE